MAKFDDDDDDAISAPKQKKQVFGGSTTEEYDAFATDHEEPKFSESLLNDPTFPANTVYKAKNDRVAIPAWARIAWFRNDHPDFGVHTDVSIQDDGDNPRSVAVATARITNASGLQVSSATKTWSRFKSGSGAFFVECAETGAVARALEFLGYSAERAKMKAVAK